MRNIEYYKKTMLQEWAELPQMFISSAENGMGKDDILNFIEEVNTRWDG
jgi:GTP-binding protein